MTLLSPLQHPELQQAPVHPRARLHRAPLAASAVSESCSAAGLQLGQGGCSGQGE